MSISDLISQFTPETNLTARPRPYFNHSVSFKKSYTPEERMRVLEETGMNVFFYPAEMVTGGDFLSDSGTTTMTDEQWAALHIGDEAYGSNRGFYILMEEIRQIFGNEFVNFPTDKVQNAFLFHQGRSAENAFFSQIGKLGSGQIIPSNGYFDTTYANVTANKIKAINLPSLDLGNKDSESYFKGDIDIIALKKLLTSSATKIPLVYLTITNNPGGGQPVSMSNIRESSELARQFKKPLFFDACRFAENAWFIKRHEEGYSKKSIPAIIHEMFSYADGFIISFKKDGLSNMGGGLFIRNKGIFTRKYPEVLSAIFDHQILTEGNPTYGGMSGRDIMALAVGLKAVIRENYLDSRIGQTRTFGEMMVSAGLPVLEPFGGHALYMDMDKFFADTKLKPVDFGGIAFTALLLGLYGHRACELGNFAFGEYDPKTKKEKLPEHNFVRFAIPRLRYEMADLASAVAATKALYEDRHNIPGIKVVYGRDLSLRHFKSKFVFRSK